MLRANCIRVRRGKQPPIYFFRWLGARTADANVEISLPLSEKRTVKRRPSDSGEFEGKKGMAMRVNSWCAACVKSPNCL